MMRRGARSRPRAVSYPHLKAEAAKQAKAEKAAARAEEKARKKSERERAKQRKQG